jgi:hypothetical protein
VTAGFDFITGFAMMDSWMRVDSNWYHFSFNSCFSKKAGGQKAKVPAAQKT